MEAPIAEEARFLAHARGGRNCFLTGMGGTGKTTTLKEFIATAQTKVDVTAPTGVAALNVGGLTVHRFCGMLLGPAPGQSNDEYFAQLERDRRRSVLAGFNRVRRCRVLVIDEISMLPGRQLEFIEFLFRRLRGRDEAFGGCQVIVTGDFLQLPPVRTGEAEPYDWAFGRRLGKRQHSGRLCWMLSAARTNRSLSGRWVISGLVAYGGRRRGCCSRA